MAYYTVSGSESAITWSLSGDDSDDFSIVAGRTVSRLEFDPKPNYQSPTDRDRDNQYQVTVHASDGTQEHTLEVTVVVEFRGLPTINGSAQVGETLTADTSGISDAHEMYFARFGYQWLADDVEIDGATSSTHTLIDSDVGKAIKVLVSFTDDAGNEETLTSAATDAVVGAGPTEAPARPSTLTASDISHDSVTLRWEDPQDDTITGYMILRRDKDIHEEGTFETVEANTGAADTTYTDTSVYPEKRYVYRIKAINAYDESEISSWVRAYTPAAPATENTPASGEPTISGTVQVGETLTAYTSNISDADGLDNATFSYQWLADDVEITGAANATHTLADADKGKAIRVRVSFTDDAGNDEALTSAATDPVAAKPNSPATGAPTISGTAQVGETLTADTSGIADEDALDNASFGYQWIADDADIPGATGSSYTLVEADKDKAIKVRVTFTDDVGNEETLTSAATDAVAAKPNSPATGAPSITGTAQVGETLTADTSGIADEDGLDNASFSYQWLADGAETAGATGSTYTLVEADEGKTVTVQVSFTDDGGNEETLTSAATAAVAGEEPTEPPAQPTGLSAEASHDSITLTWDDPGDDTITGYVILRRNRDTDAEGQFTTLVADTGTAAKTYTDDMVEAETPYTYRIKAINAHGTSERSRWVHVDTPAAPTSEPPAEPTPEPNTPATGAPAITGRAQVGETLTADTSGIAEEDGLTNATFGHQWIADDADISGATSSSYTLRDTDEGKAIKVRVSFTDDAGNEETLTSAATDAVASSVPTEPPAKPRTLRATEVSHDKVTLTWRDPQDNTITGYEILRRDKDVHEEGIFETVEANTGTADTTYTDTSVEPEKRYVYRVKAINAYDESEMSSWVRAYTPAAPATENTPATGAPSISGTAQVGETLTAYTSDIADEDGLDNAAFTYQWLAGDADISGATGSSYTLADDDRGKTVKVRVSFTDDAGNTETLTSTATAAVAAKPNTPATGAPNISGTAQVGETLTADTSGIADADGMDNAAFSYQWIAGGTDISGAAGSGYILTADEEGLAIQVWVSFTDDAGNPEAMTSDATEAVVAKPNAPATGAPTISGTAQVGETLTAETSGIADQDGLSNGTFSYQWLADNAEIAGATNSTHTLTEGDKGKALRVRVSFTDDAGNEETLTSDATEAVVAKPNAPATGQPTISGTAQVGETLTADTSGIADEDGLGNGTFSYQWLAGDVEITGATNATYTLADAEEGKAIKVRVSFNDDAGNTETLTSAATAAVAAKPAPLTAEFLDTPGSHDGQGAFTFELRFSENLSLSYKKLRDHAFTVTGGEVTNARRLEQGSNVRWEITVRPDGEGGVTVTLPETTDCSAQGAICTGDGRKLSNRTELTVAGPGQ